MNQSILSCGSLAGFPTLTRRAFYGRASRAATALSELALQTDKALAEIGVVEETHPFSAAPDSGANQRRVPLQRLRAKVEELQAASIGQFSASEFFLFRSDPGSNASIYRKLRRYKFEPELGKSAKQPS